MTHEPFETQAAAYVLGALESDERVEFERHLATGCLQCQALLRESDETLAALAAQLPPAVPPAGVKAALLQRIDADRRRRQRAMPARQGWFGWAAAAVAAMLIGGLAVSLLLANRYETRLAELTGELAGLRAEQARAQAVLDLLRDPATRLVFLQGAGPSPEAVGRVVWNETAGGWVFVAKLPPAKPGTTYEVWTFSGGRPSPAGIFDVDAAGSAMHRIDATVRPVESFAVTLEPAGGVPAPTGPIVLAGL